MNTLYKTFIVLLSILSFRCSSEKDCSKVIIVQNAFILSSPTGTTIIPEIRQEVDCSFPEPTIAETVSEFPELSEFSYEVLDFSFTIDTTNNTNRLTYTLQLHNLSSNTVRGFAMVTTNADGFIATSPNNSSCLEISANSSCNINFD